MRLIPRLMLMAVVAFTSISCDQVTKSVAATKLKGCPEQALLGDTIRLSYAENPGAFLSLGANLEEPLRSWLMTGLTGTLVAVLLVAALRSASLTKLHFLGLALVASGGAGNLIDRIAYGSVRDFMNVGVGPIRTGIFNVADIAITGGVVLLLLSRSRGGDT